MYSTVLLPYSWHLWLCVVFLYSYNLRYRRTHGADDYLLFSYTVIIYGIIAILMVLMTMCCFLVQLQSTVVLPYSWRWSLCVVFLYSCNLRYYRHTHGADDYVLFSFTVIIYGIIAVLMALMTMQMKGPATQIALGFLGAAGGPLMGMYLLGSTIPWANSIVSWLTFMCSRQAYIYYWHNKNSFRLICHKQNVYVHTLRKSTFFNSLSPHDALKHHFISLKTDFIFLQLRVFEWKFPSNWFTNTW